MTIHIQQTDREEVLEAEVKKLIKDVEVMGMQLHEAAGMLRGLLRVRLVSPEAGRMIEQWLKSYESN